MAELDLADIQGFILRGYTMPLMRHFILRVAVAPAARSVLGALVSGDATIPQLTTAVAWEVKPDTCLNIGLTYEGLKALGVAQSSLDSFPVEFVEDAVARAAEVGDVGANAPENWKSPMASSDVHAIAFVTAQTNEALEAVTSTLRALFGRDGALEEVACYDGAVVDGTRAHFGYCDGFSQPNVKGAPRTGGPDPLPVAETGSFLLGYDSDYSGLKYPVPTPNDLGHNGSYAAYRILEQDCTGFEQFLQDAAASTGLDAEMVAAKICGRWRNGVPLALSPDTDAPIAPEQMNNFDYLPTEASPDSVDDSRGMRCPIGSHIRRANPRSSRIAGNGGHRHRLMRRGLPYGPRYDAANPNDGIERGLLGIFICASLLDQYEFLMSEWIENGTFAPGLGTSKDVILGGNSAASSKFSIPTATGTKKITGFSQFVTTRGGAYCFLPSVTALKYLGAL